MVIKLIVIFLITKDVVVERHDETNDVVVREELDVVGVK